METPIKISKEEYDDHVDGYDGVCLACEQWTVGDCEPDDLTCDLCGEPEVFGCEEALMMGDLEVVEEE